MRDLREYNKAYYQRRKETRLPEVLARQKDIKRQVQEYKLERGCSECGYNRCARALQFHHTSDDKEHAIGRMTTQGRSFSSILLEIEKCILLCSNCHAEIHADESECLTNAGMAEW